MCLVFHGGYCDILLLVGVVVATSCAVCTNRRKIDTPALWQTFLVPSRAGATRGAVGGLSCSCQDPWCGCLSEHSCITRQLAQRIETSPAVQTVSVCVLYP